MGKDTQAGAHVEFPDDVGCSVVLADLFPIRTTIAIAETLGVEATKLTLSGDVIQPVPFYIRCTCRRWQQEIPQAALYSRGHVLPKERAIRDSKSHEHACSVLKGGVHLPGIVGAYIDHIAGNNGTTKRLVSQLDAPEYVSTGRRIPVNWRISH